MPTAKRGKSSRLKILIPGAAVALSVAGYLGLRDDPALFAVQARMAPVKGDYDDR